MLVSDKPELQKNTSGEQNSLGGGGQHSTEVANLLPDPAALGSLPSIHDFFSEKKLSCFQETGRWLESVDRTHLVLASGKLVLQKHSFG